MRKYILFAVALFSFATTALAGVPRAKDPTRELKVMSLAVRSASQDNGLNIYWNNRWPAVRTATNTINPSILLIQQAEWGQMLSAFDNDCPQYDKVWFPNIEDKEKSQYTCIYYNKEEFSVVNSGHFWLSATPDKVSVGWNGCTTPRDATWAILHDKVKDADIFVLNCEMEHAMKCIRNSLPLIQNTVHEITGYGMPIIIGGLFWVTQKDEVLNDMHRDFRDAVVDCPKTDKVPSYNDFGSGVSNKINADHIFYRYFTGVEYKTEKKVYEGVPYMSDHYPIVATIKY